MAARSWRFESSPGHQNFMKLETNGKNYPIVFEEVMKLSSSVRIKNGKVVIKLSRFLIGRQRDETVEKFLKWAGKRLSKVRTGTFVEPNYENGGRVVTHNKIYEVHVVNGKRTRVGLKNGCEIVVQLGKEGGKSVVKKLCEKVIMEDQEKYLGEILRELNENYFRVSFNNFRFKRMQTRFGSCSSKRNINIAFRLLFAPREVFRYVCAHELAHLKEFNHSKRFWALVEEAVADYKNQERWLKENGFLLG